MFGVGEFNITVRYPTPSRYFLHQRKLHYRHCLWQKIRGLSLVFSARRAEPVFFWRYLPPEEKRISLCPLCLCGEFVFPVASVKSVLKNLCVLCAFAVSVFVFPMSYSSKQFLHQRYISLKPEGRLPSLRQEIK